jgi:NTP pyrophosphatase (non-canonical NTP hydrolase)
VSIAELIADERDRQEGKARAGEFAWTCSDPDVSHEQRLAVLVEEVGEVARAVLGASGAVSDGGNLRRELVEVAAVAVAWLEAMEE